MFVNLSSAAVPLPACFVTAFRRSASVTGQADPAVPPAVPPAGLAEAAGAPVAGVVAVALVGPLAAGAASSLHAAMPRVRLAPAARRTRLRAFIEISPKTFAVVDLK